MNILKKFPVKKLHQFHWFNFRFRETVFASGDTINSSSTNDILFAEVFIPIYCLDCGKPLHQTQHISSNFILCFHSNSLINWRLVMHATAIKFTKKITEYTQNNKIQYLERDFKWFNIRNSKNSVIGLAPLVFDRFSPALLFQNISRRIFFLISNQKKKNSTKFSTSSNFKNIYPK